MRGSKSGRESGMCRTRRCASDTISKMWMRRHSNASGVERNRREVGCSLAATPVTTHSRGTTYSLLAAFGWRALWSRLLEVGRRLSKDN